MCVLRPKALRCIEKVILQMIERFYISQCADYQQFEKICEDPVLINAFFIKNNSPSSSASAPASAPAPSSSSSSSPDHTAGASFSLVGPLIPHLYVL